VDHTVDHISRWVCRWIPCARVWPIEASRLWLIYYLGVLSRWHDDKGRAVFHGVAYCGLLVHFPGDLCIVLVAKDVHQTRAVFRREPCPVGSHIHGHRRPARTR